MNVPTLKKVAAMRGMTLFELLIVITLIATLLTLSLASYGHIDRYYTQNAARAISKSIMMTRNTAIKMNQTVYMCISNDGQSCVKSGGNRVIIYLNQDNDQSLSEGDQILRTEDLSSFHVKANWKAFQNRRYLKISPTGMANYQNGTFTVCAKNADATTAQGVIVNQGGRPYFAKDQNGDGIKQNGSGNALSCTS